MELESVSPPMLFYFFKIVLTSLFLIFENFIDFKFKTKSSLNHKIQFEQVAIQCL